MNPLVAAILPTLINLAEHLISAEGPSVIRYLQDELLKLEAKYAPAGPVGPSPAMDKGMTNR